ncbi:MAG: DUF1127 domain-containing protein [Rhodobacteraceae bacterium]|nr:DUF1127 domain-containing protein [Paracoccaceae bacterium]
MSATTGWLHSRAGVISLAQEWVREILAAHNRSRSFRQTVTELQSLDDRELNDIGISRHDIVSIARSVTFD